MPGASGSDELIAAMARAQTEDELHAELANVLLKNTRAEVCDILIGEPGSLVLRASTLAPEYNVRLRIGRSVGVAGLAFETGAPLFLTRNAEKHPSYARYPGLEDTHTEGMAVVPMGCEEEPCGVVILRRSSHWKFTAAEKRHVQELVDTATKCYLGYRNAFEAGAQSNRLGALSEVSKTLSASPYLEEILQLLVNLTAQQFNYAVCTVRLLDEARGELVLRATQSQVKAYQRKRAIKLGESIAGRVIQLGRTLIVPDVVLEEDYIGHDLAVEQGLKSMICVPLTMQGKSVGVLTCYTTVDHEFPPDEVKALETLAKQAALSIEHAKLQVRSTLMQEMHHRVKNNLQQVASLLRLQLRHSRYKSLEEALNDTLSRILAISAVHELLSREDLDHVGLRSIGEALVQHQQRSLILPDRTLRFEIRGADVHLGTAQATQVALILNELILNAVEHGFRVTRDGDVHINVEEREGEVALWVSNSGDPLPEGFDVANQSHLGLQIVENLARALGGRFKLENRLGWAVAELRFTRLGSE